MERFQVIDADGHVEESAASLQKYLKKENRGRPLWTSDAWDRDFGKTLGKSNEDPRVQLADMDVDGIDVQVIYPTRGISLSAAREVDLAVDIAHAYNDWLAEFCSTNPERLKGVALVALQDVAAAIKEARRAVEELGFVGVMMPTNVLDQDIGLRQFWPFYEEVERLNVGLAFHGGIRASQRMHGRFGSFIAVHTLAFPLECMVALTGYIYSGAPEQFPKLRIAALEASCGWVPFLMDRMDEEFEIRGKREAPLLKRKPSEVSYQRAVLLRLRIGRNHFALRCGAHRIGQAALLLRLSPLGHLVAELGSRRDETQRPYRLTQEAAPGRKRAAVLRFQDFVFAGSRLSVFGLGLFCCHQAQVGAGQTSLALVKPTSLNVDSALRPS